MAGRTVSELPPLGAARVFWQGPHTFQRVSGRPLQSPLGKVHAEGLALLAQHGWLRVSPEDPRVPGFAFTTRKGADFPAGTIPGLPMVRQFPQRCTAVLDDKGMMAECFVHAGCAGITPPTWTDIDAFVREHSSVCVSTSDRSSDEDSSNCSKAERLWFLKHRHGVKGQAVYPFASLPALLARLAAIRGEHSRRQFVVQAGVAPPLLLHSGRKFTLRAHVLVLLAHQQGQEAQPAGGPPGLQGQAAELEGAHVGLGLQREQQGQQQGQQQGLGGQHIGQQGQQQGQPALHVYVHEDLIVQEHARALSTPAPAAAAVVGAPAAEEEPSTAPASVEGPTASAAVAAGTAEGTAAGVKAAADEAAAAAAVAAAAGVQAAGQGEGMAVCGGRGRTQTAATRSEPSASSRAARLPVGEADAWVHVSSRGRGHPRPYLLSSLAEQQQQRYLKQQEQEQEQGQEQEGEQGVGEEPPLADAAALQRELWPQVCSISAAAVSAAAQHGLVPAGADPRASLYHLFALDFAVAAPAPGPAAPAAQLAAAVPTTMAAPAAGEAASAAGQAGESHGLQDSTSQVQGTVGEQRQPEAQLQPGAQQHAQQHAQQQGGEQAQQRQQRPRVYLLEANAYPAIASGTMKAVPRSVYTRLLGDLARLVVLPALGAGGSCGTGGSDAVHVPQRGGFHRVL